VIDEWLGLASNVSRGASNRHGCLERHGKSPPQALVEPAIGSNNAAYLEIRNAPEVLPSPASMVGREPATGPLEVLSFQPGKLGDLTPSIDLGASARSGFVAGNTLDCITRPGTAGSAGSMLPPVLAASLREPLDEDVASVVPPLDLALDFVMGFEEVVDTEAVHENRPVSGASAPSETESIAVSDLVELKQDEMQVHNWPRIGSRLCRNLIAESDRPPMFPKTQWSDPTTTTDASEPDSQQLSAEWLRGRWNQLRKPEITRPPSRPSSSCFEDTPGRLMQELTSFNAFHQKLAELQWDVGGGSLPPLDEWAAAQEDVPSPTQAWPCVGPAANISTFGPGALPPPPNFDPPEFRSLCLQQDARAQTGGSQW